jgi:Na+/H+ antiporter NhaD/arsenite permease-like protein
MEVAIILVFVIGYAMIALEHPLKIDKAASALLTGVLCWTLYVFSGPGHDTVEHGHDIVEHKIGTRAEFEETGLTEEAYLEEHFKDHPELAESAAIVEKSNGEMVIYEKHGDEHQSGLVHHLFDIGAILFFLMGAMTIVELVDAHEGFSIITDKIRTTSKVKLAWTVGLITFFLSAALDNLTTAIVMISLLKKLVDDKETRWFYAGLVIIAANAGGAWSPIGDVTTTMLWIKGQLPDVGPMIIHLILPALVCLILPLLILTFTMKGEIKRPLKSAGSEHYLNPTSGVERNLVFALGIGGLIFVPVFKSVTHLPPFMGMMFSLGILWVVTEILHRSKNKEEKNSLSVIHVLHKIDTASVLFFLGILLAVAALQEYGILGQAAQMLDEGLGNFYAVDMSIGALSAIVDNVPLVAAAQGMYEIAPDGVFAASGQFWEFLAYCAGTGGSMLIIGSAAGVAVMGLEHISFGWYLKKMSLLALVGYVGGALVYIAMFGL